MLFQQLHVPHLLRFFLRYWSLCYQDPLAELLHRLAHMQIGDAVFQALILENQTLTIQIEYMLVEICNLADCLHRLDSTCCVKETRDSTQ